MRHPISPPESSAVPSAAGCRFAVVVSRFNREITDRLLAGARQALIDAGASTECLGVMHVPGAFEIPVVAHRLASSGHYDGILCLGCVIRGATPHFEHICRTCADGIQHAALTTGVPVIFGVVMAETKAQAEERSGGSLGNVGEQGARTLIEMAQVMRSIANQRPSTSK